MDAKDLPTRRDGNAEVPFITIFGLTDSLRRGSHRAQSMKSLWLLMMLMVLLCGAAGLRAEPLFKPDDVVALVGGEDMVLENDHPVLEPALRCQPGLATVMVRNLAWEGDTVFEQARPLHFPAWPEALRRAGATVIVARFGKMESYRGAAGVTEFAAAYAKLLDVMVEGGRRRVVLVAPAPPVGEAARAAFPAYGQAIRELAAARGWAFRESVEALVGGGDVERIATSGKSDKPDAVLPRLIKEKNTLWYHYWRPQNWAFLHGDRTEQPSSRDHRDPRHRWFPEEMERWLPLLEAKEQAILTHLQEARRP